MPRPDSPTDSPTKRTPAASATHQQGRQPGRQQGRQQGRQRSRGQWNAPLLRRIILVECVILAGIVALAVVRAVTQAPGTGGTSTTASSACGRAGVYLREAAGVVVCDARPRLEKYDTKLLGLMSPAVDPNGDLWIGAMATSSLIQYDPRSGKSQSWPVPEARNLVMDTAVDLGGNIWFAEQGSGYIGRLDPRARTFTQFPVRGADGRPAGAQGLWFDLVGKLWFTVPQGGWVGRLDPATGKIAAYRVPARGPDAPAVPYDLALSPDGRVWFGYLDGGAIGELDPATGQVKLHLLKDPNGRVFSIAPDGKGRVWFTEFTDSRIGYVAADTGAVREIEVPATLGKAAVLYGIATAPSGDVWFGSFGASSIIRYTPDTGKFTFFRLDIGRNAPYELAFDLQGRLWFTSQGGTPSYLGMLDV